MTTEASIGFNTLFQIFDETVSPSAWTTIAEVTSITPPALARDAQDATHTESTGGWREFIPGLKDGGEVSVEMNFIPGGAGVALILSQFNSSDLTQCRVLFPDGTHGANPTSTIWAFNAVCTGFAPEAPIDDVMKATAKFKVTGQPTFSPAA
jgi:predicted secreted protein